MACLEINRNNMAKTPILIFAYELSLNGSGQRFSIYSRITRKCRLRDTDNRQPKTPTFTHNSAPIYFGNFRSNHIRFKLSIVTHTASHNKKITVDPPINKPDAPDLMQ
jgi:hypothetical protein